MRILSLGLVALALVVCYPLGTRANGIPAQSRSSYGSGPGAGFTEILNTETIDDSSGNAFAINVVCTFSNGCPSDGGSYVVEVIVPNLPNGTTIDITGLGETVGVYCKDSFFGDCTSTDSSGDLITLLSADQQTCVNDLSETFNSGTDAIQDGTSTPCSLAVMAGNNSVALIFDLNDYSSSSPFPAISISTVSSTSSMPEPASLALLGAGLFGLLLRGMKRA
ncbi:MAG TPA: PEP-CTERM sorting domain-containing protein [Candidatus Acidoferrum sp.]|nr:PEP-CTERM sorting domain-containing protein [Candidatus Acidoferrum sp.]